MATMSSSSNELDAQIISKEAIKPSSPTPSHLKTYNLSFSDNFCPPVYIPLIFFYPYSGSSNTATDHEEKAAQLLKKSLSQTLTQYYPFSGRLRTGPDGSYVDCNDEGVEFVEVRANAQLSQVVHSHYQSKHHPFFQTGSLWGPASYDDSLVKVQLSYFSCGGLAIAVSLSHKIGDTCTLFTFIQHWATVTYNHYNLDNQQATKPLPPQIISSQKSVCSEILFRDGNKCVSKRFVFPNSKIQQLKAKEGNKSTTRVEALNSLLYCCAVRAAKANRPISFCKVFVLVQTVNLRKRLANSLQETTVGNFSWVIIVQSNSKTRLALKSLIAQIQNAKSKLAGMTISRYNRLQKKAFLFSKYVPKIIYEGFTCTSLCGYGVYRVDFGWGNPIRVNFPVPNDQYFILMETPSEDGIEVVVSLKEEDMAKFQADDQLLAYAFAA